MNDFDNALLTGLGNGYFDPFAIHQHAAVLHKNREHGDAGTAMERAWAQYHDSFDNNQEQALDAIHDAFVANITHIEAVNLNGTIRYRQRVKRGAAVSHLPADSSKGA
jgi:hypothetical protein